MPVSGWLRGGKRVELQYNAAATAAASLAPGAQLSLTIAGQKTWTGVECLVKDKENGLQIDFPTAFFRDPEIGKHKRQDDQQRSSHFTKRRTAESEEAGQGSYQQRRKASY